MVVIHNAERTRRGQTDDLAAHCSNIPSSRLAAVVRLLVASAAAAVVIIIIIINVVDHRVVPHPPTNDETARYRPTFVDLRVANNFAWPTETFKYDIFVLYA